MKYIVLMQLTKTSRVEYSYNAVQYNIIFYTALQWLKYYKNQRFYSEETPHTSSYGVFL